MGRFVIAVSLVVMLACARKGPSRSASAAIPVLSPEMDSVDAVTTVKICINWKGEVISAEYLPDKSTSTDTSKINQSVRLAKTYKFEERQGSSIQCGTVTFKFKQKKQ
jgi:hypothetical protein